MANEQIEVDTPNVALSFLRPGNYRVEVNESGDTTVVKVSEGEAEAMVQGESVVVRDQQVATFRGFDQLAAQFDTLGSSDEFDSWSMDRDRRHYMATPSQTIQYVSPDVTGYEDLDDHGTWSSEAEYGYVWTPSHVAADWSPYRYGRWSYVNPWGWTWIDDASWGYAPFHYGRWAHVRNRWCWVPGPRHSRAVYAPAQVGWVGSPRATYAGSFAGVAWFPLGPREVYVPARRFSPRYVERLNVSNSTIISRVVVREVYENRARNVTYRNHVVPGAVTAVSRATFTSSQRVGNHRVRLNEQEFARATASASPPQIAPVLESRLGGRPRANVRPPPQTIVNRRVVVRRDPPPPAAHLATPAAPANRSPRAQAVSEAVNRNRPERAPRNVRPATEAPRSQQETQASEVRQRVQQQLDRAREQRNQQQQNQQHQQRQQPQPQHVETRPPPRPVEQRQRQVEQPRVEQKPQEVRVSRPTVQQPAESKPPKQRDDQPRAHRN